MMDEDDVRDILRLLEKTVLLCLELPLGQRALRAKAIQPDQVLDAISPRHQNCPTNRERTIAVFNA